MKKSIITSFLVLMCLAGITSCDSDDDLKLTKENGRPSSVEHNSESKTFFYYEGNRLKTIKEIKGSISNYDYKDGKLVSVYYSPEDKRVADGHASVRFEQVGNKIYIAAWGEPMFGEYRSELDMDDSGLPQRITEIGYFSHNKEGEMVLESEGNFYTEFTYDPVKKNLLKLAVFEKESLRQLTTYDFEYDNNPGAFSKIDMPLWYYAFQMYRNKDSIGEYTQLYYCYGNNILKEKITGKLTEDAAIQEDIEVIYRYEYNKDKYPMTQATDYYGLIPLSITY